MMPDWRVRRYQRFLKSLKRPESRLCSCPLHLHPRPWVPPPCRTTRPYRDESLFRRTYSNPELASQTRQPYRMQRSHLGWESDDDGRYSQSHIERLYRDARLVKEAYHKVRRGDRLPKDTCNIIRKWSKRRVPDGQGKVQRHGKKKEMQTDADNYEKKKKEEEGRSQADIEKEEEALREELRNLRELTQSNLALVEENKKLMRKVHQLRQRIKRQEAAEKGSRDSVAAEKELGTREEFVITSLKKKYEDLLQYVLKVEAENQKLKSLVGVSGEREGYFDDSDQEAAEFGPRVVARLRDEVDMLRTELLKKDEYIVACEQRLQRQDVEDTSRTQAAGEVNIDTKTLEQEWMRRLTETREIYDRAIQGYKNQLGELEEKVVASEAAHAQQMQDLADRLSLEQSRTKQLQDQLEEMNKSQVEGRSEQSGRVEHAPDPLAEKDKYRCREDFGEVANDSVTSSSPESERTSQQKDRGDGSSRKLTEPKKDKDINKNQTRHDEASGVSVGTARHKQPQAVITVHDKGSQTTASAAVAAAGDEEKYCETLRNIAKRLEDLNVGGDEVETTVAVIKETINRCLQEWKLSFQREEGTQGESDEADQLKKNYEDLHRKLKGKNRKIESLQKQCQDLEQQNTKLQHQCLVLESRSASHVTSQLDALQSLPQQLHDVEQKLQDTRELLQQAQAENKTLEEQAQLLRDKLNKKEAKLKGERDHNAGREKEVAHLQETISSLQRRMEEISKEVRHMHEQLSTKDSILERTSAQLEERIRECARLSSLVEHSKFKQNQETDRIKAQLEEQDSASHRQYLEAQALASRYQAQLSSLRSEKDHVEKSLRNNVRKLEEQVDQLQLRNTTLQRQLTTITSTYHATFSSIDMNPPTPVLPSSSMKGL